jgi:hypothetical protein
MAGDIPKLLANILKVLVLILTKHPGTPGHSTVCKSRLFEKEK